MSEDQIPFYKRWKLLWWVIVAIAFIAGPVLTALSSRNRKNSANDVINNEPRAPDELYDRQEDLQNKANDQIADMNAHLDNKPEPTEPEGDFGDMIAKHNKER